jgi:hypothetical protein
LTNENPDPEYLPDHVHSSSHNDVFLVYALKNYSQNALVSNAAGVSLTVTFIPVVQINNSYIYAKINDSYLGLSLTSVVRASDGKQLKLIDNVWRTQRTWYYLVCKKK